MATRKVVKKVKHAPIHKDKLAIFDIDWTLIKPLSDSTFPKDASDWQWLRQSVPEILNFYDEQGYIVILWTNQSKTWKITMINDMLTYLDFEPELVICTHKSNYKPDVEYFWESISTDCRTINLDLDESFMVGDALGRDGDHSSCDLDGATNLGIDCYAPEDIFAEDPSDTLEIVPSEENEIIIMCGYPGSGKTTLANTMRGYRVLSLDDIKTVPKLLKAAEIQIQYTSVIFDATNMTADKRKVYIDFAAKHNLPIRCAWIDMTAQKSIDRNVIRGQEGGRKVPNVAIYKMRKTFEPPTKEEGMEVIHFRVV